MKRRSERGQSLVELGVSMLILLFLLAGAAEFGVLFFQYVQLRDAAQEGALYGSMNPGNLAEILNRVRHSSASPLDLDALITSGDVGVAVSIDGVASGAAGYSSIDCEGHGIEVLVTYNHEIFMPFMPQILGRSDIPLEARVVDTILTPHQCTP
jgi:hypothetical protein